MIDDALNVLDILGFLGDTQAFEFIGVPSPGMSNGVPPEVEAVKRSADKRLAQNPNDVDALYTRALAWRAKGRFKEASADAIEVIRLQPEHARAWLFCSEVLGYISEHDRARQARQRALELDPTLG